MVKSNILSLENKIHIFALPCNILYVLSKLHLLCNLNGEVDITVYII